MAEQYDEFRMRMADILLGSLHVETRLDFFIKNYFVRPQTNKTFFLNDSLLHRLDFKDKIHIFRDICKREGFDMDKLKEVTKAIKQVQETRNKVAHWEAHSNPLEIKLRSRKSFTTEKDVLKLDDKSMKEFDDARMTAITGTTDFYIMYHKEGTRDEREVK